MSGRRAAAATGVARRRLALYYAGLAIVTAVVVATVIGLGAGREAAAPIAGGYDVSGPGRVCLGRAFDVTQSGQFVAIDGATSGAAGKLRLRDKRLTGAVLCVRGADATLVATVGERKLVGRAGDAPFRAELRRDPPPPGAQKPRPPASVHGEYAISPRSDCLGGSLEIGEGDRAPVVVGGGTVGSVVYRNGAIAGRVTCSNGRAARLAGTAVSRRLDLTIARERVTATKQREFGRLLAAFFIAVAVVMICARLAGTLIAKIGQPRVMGEVAAGILLGPTLVGAIAPDLEATLFPPDVIPLIGVAANLGLIFYMFLVGLELDVSQLRGRVGQALAISNTGVVIPMAAGMLVALPVFELVAPDTSFLPFALFMGVAMSITAFPVLARILVERRMLRRPVGALALAAAAIDDVTAWFLIALATAVAVAGSFAGVVRTVALAAGFCVVMGLLVRRLLARVAVAYDEAGRVPVTWITAIFAGILVAAFTTEVIGIALIFGAFVMGAIMPRHAGLTEDVTHRMEDFVVLLLLPLFFAYTGLRTNVLLLDRPSLVVLTLVLFVVAVACKFGGTLLAARVTAMSWRESAVIGALMNTRGLTELIVLNLALEKGVISQALFAALVIMALATTFMTGPLLRVLDPDGTYSAPVEQELDEARRRSELDVPVPIPDRAILLAPRSAGALGALISVAAPLARSVPPRELILTEILEPSRGGAFRGALQTENRRLADADAHVQRARAGLLEDGIAARAVSFISAERGRDLRRLAEREDVDLILLDGRRPLLGGSIPRGDVGEVLMDAPCDVAVLVSRESDAVALDRGAVTVAFGGAEHDWAALELGGWLAAATGAPLRLVGAGGDGQGRDAGRLLADASLLLQTFTGVAAETRLIPPGRDGVLEAGVGSSLLVLGLSQRWRAEGLGETREAIVREARWPTLFVRRGERAGALAPRDSITQFGWSIAAGGPPAPVPVAPGPRS
jgi:Kef-type K+ transport system membrane component KefB